MADTSEPATLSAQNYNVLPAFNAANGKVWFLIDGQQRVSVIHHVREGTVLKNAHGKQIEFRRVVLSLAQEDDGQQIRYRKPLLERYVPMSDVLHPNGCTASAISADSKRSRPQVPSAFCVIVCT